MDVAMKRVLPWLASVLALILPFAAAAQQQGLELDIVGGNASATPIAVVPMPYQGSGAAPATNVAEVITADLNRSGQFRGLPRPASPSARPVAARSTTRPGAAQQNYLVVGRVLDAAAAATARIRVVHVGTQERMLGFALTARATPCATSPTRPPMRSTKRSPAGVARSSPDGLRHRDGLAAMRATR